MDENVSDVLIERLKLFAATPQESLDGFRSVAARLHSRAASHDKRMKERTLESILYKDGGILPLLIELLEDNYRCKSLRWVRKGWGCFKKCNMPLPYSVVLNSRLAKSTEDAYERHMPCSLEDKKYHKSAQHIANYLQNRKFQVRIGEALSTSRNIEASVPEGSVLAPVLYSIYVQDMPTMPDCLHSLYADDTVIFTRHFNIHAACVNMQNALNILTQWSTKWRLKVNGEKSQLMVFTKRFPRIIDQLSIQNQIIPFTTSVKYLRVLLDKRLSYRHHIQNIRDKAFQRYMALYPLFKSLTSRKAKVLLYTSAIRSYIHYCCEIWGQAHPRHLKSLEGIQNNHWCTLPHEQCQTLQ
ncbi:hypothetical protein ANN_05852 [Periplaneta americana]|uniref:Reverse transcriptase domain-containing protein n=1 Tax=Periplaneta americana TaxID=6978 RepID=A0ABQ8TDP8_PERAM|nr:hypothetical protein ANN_05852 [Periplaneta americana]